MKLMAKLSVLLTLLAVVSPVVHGANKLLIEPLTVSVGQAGVTIPVRLDNDQALYAYSLSITSDPSKLKITGLDLVGTPVADAGWSFGEVLDGGGRISWGVVLDITEPFDLQKTVPVGAKVLVANLKVDVTAASSTTSTVQFQNVAATPTKPATVNQLVIAEGDTVPFTTQAGTVTIQAGGVRFRRGDADNNGQLELTDAIRILGFLFLGSAGPTCAEAADVDDDGEVSLTDAIRILNYLFTGGPPPESPGPPPNECGPDRPGSPSNLGCDEYTC